MEKTISRIKKIRCISIIKSGDHDVNEFLLICLKTTNLFSIYVW